MSSLALNDIATQDLQHQLNKCSRQRRLLIWLPLVPGVLLGLVGLGLGVALGAGVGIATGGLAIGIPMLAVILISFLGAASFGGMLGYIVAMAVILVMKAMGR